MKKKIINSEKRFERDLISKGLGEGHRKGFGHIEILERLLAPIVLLTAIPLQTVKMSRRASVAKSTRAQGKNIDKRFERDLI